MHFFQGNFISKLRGMYTVVVLLVCSTIIFVYQNFGQAIACSADGNYISESFLNEFCWVHSTYTVAVRDSKSHKIVYTANDSVLAEKGVRPTTDDKLDYNTFYQWVALVLLIQALFFYLPHHILKIIQGERINKSLLREELSRSQTLYIVNNFGPRSCYNDVYCTAFIIAKVLSLVNVILQIWLTNDILGNEFTTYGWKIFEFTGMKPYERTDPFSEIFPKVISCEINRYSQTGGKLTTYDALCVLPINIINEKIYALLWFWFVAVALLLVCEFCSMLAFCKRSLRIAHLKNSLLIRSTTQLHAQIDLIGNRLKFSDWFLLLQIERNVDRATYLELIRALTSYYINHWLDRQNLN